MSAEAGALGSGLVAEGLAVAVGGRPFIEAASAVAGPGEFIGLIGPNGAGKSTLLRALAGLVKPAAGAVRLDGADVAAIAPRDLARRRAYLPQQREIAWSYAVEAVVALGRFAYGAPGRLSPADRAAVDRALTATGLLDLRARDAHSLSGGEAARMHLARALAAEAPVLLADEPTESLDLSHQLTIMRTLQAQARNGGLVIAALHDLDLAARHCSRLIAIDRGRIVADGPASSVLSAERLACVFGVVEDGRGFRLYEGRP